MQAMAERVQPVTGESVQIAFVEQGCTGAAPVQAAAEHGIQLNVVKLPEVKRSFVRLPRCFSILRMVASTNGSSATRPTRLWREKFLSFGPGKGSGKSTLDAHLQI